MLDMGNIPNTRLKAIIFTWRPINCTAILGQTEAMIAGNLAQLEVGEKG